MPTVIFEPPHPGAEFWRRYPVRIPGHSTAQCHHRETILVRSMEGGFVTRNCPQCGQHDTLPEGVFLHQLDLWVACPRCQRRTRPAVLEDRNYGYVCDRCQLAIRLCDLLPYWHELPQMVANPPAPPPPLATPPGALETRPLEPAPAAPAHPARLSPPALAMAQVLLDHHRAKCRGRHPRPSISSAAITYGELCIRAGLEDLTRAAGQFLGEIAELCQREGWPTLNALVVNQDTRMPGEGYERAAGCSLLTWPDAAGRCIVFDGYPERVVHDA